MLLDKSQRTEGAWRLSWIQQEIPALEPVEPGYKSVLRVRMSVFWVALWAIGAVADQVFLQPTPVAGLPTFGIPVLGLVAIVTAPQRIYRRLRYKLTDRLLQVVRGWIFHIDTVVPSRPRPASRRDKRAAGQDVWVSQPGSPHGRHPQQHRHRARPCTGARRRDPRHHPRACPNRLRLTTAAVGPPERLHPLFLVTGLGKSLRGMAGAYAAVGYLGVSGRLGSALFANRRPHRLHGSSA